ncbi:cob(I)yrinic acid a,c-diamide adenosyltransferase [Mangrovibacterium marinum]|uniref:Corrinoid adenosyltransferase n=1 Tax=Mangrovibacterium marinum TaxID=1639118 RepID=A0A2T5BY22_9BACT|nr:cob(I)yrinic acid a,c-diamide adenosyltransferase [Mangrovibacterium marinum]PTN06340.1 cob(I)alamin adenosyltransferase [Mangrovibacterium marinum]
MAKEFRIYTKTGDDGTTGLIGGSRVKKYDSRLEAYGTVDELNSFVGLVLSGVEDERVRKLLTDVQAKLFVIGAHLAMDENAGDLKQQLPCSEVDIEALEKEMDRMFEELPRLNHFILPTGCQTAAYAHVARTVCRRAERRIVELADKISVDENLVKYINRLSDYLFVLSRKLNQDKKIPETPWIPG